MTQAYMYSNLGTLAQGETTIFQVTKIDGPKRSVEVKELNILSSITKVKLPGLIDAGDLTFSVYFAPQNASHQYLTTQTNGSALPDVASWTYTYSDGSTDAFSAFISEVSPAAEVGEYVTCDVTLTLTGTHTDTAGS